MPAAAVFFDVDGTLVPGTSSGQYLASFLGHRDAVAAAEAAWAAGLADGADVERLDARGYAGVSPARLRTWLAGLPLVDGIGEVVRWCAGRDVLPVLATLAWAPVGAWLCDRFGFAASCGPCLEEAGGRFTGAVALHFDEFAKRDFALETARAAGLGPDRCAAVGDSRSDVPLFRAAGLAVSFNGDARAAGLADACCTGGDLRRVLPFLDRWLDSLGA